MKEIGEGRPVLLLHGSPGDASSWNAVIDELQGSYRLLIPTLPGHERGDRRPVDLEMKDVAAQVAESVGRLEQPAVLVGHSFGANVALEIAMRGGRGIHRMILFEPVLFQVLDTAGRSELHRETSRFFHAYVEDYEDGNDRVIGRMVDFWFGRGAFDRLPDRMRDFLRGQTETNVRDVKATLRRHYSRLELFGVTAPTLVAYGGSSPPVVWHIAQAVAHTVAEGDTTIVEGANHGMLATHPGDVARLIDEFIAAGARPSD